MLCQLLPVNRRARFEFSVLCPEIYLHLASYLESPSAPCMPNYPFPNLKMIPAKSDSSNIINFHIIPVCEIRPRSSSKFGILSFRSHLSFSTLGYIWTVRWTGKEVPLQLHDGFHDFSGSVRKENRFPPVLTWAGSFLYFSQQNIGIVFCIDDPTFQKEIKMDNSFSNPKRMLPLLFQPRLSFLVFSPLSLSLSLSLSSLSEDFTPFEHSSSGETCFSKMFLSLQRISDGWTPPTVRNLIIHCSTLTDTFCSLISLVELRQD